MRLCHCEPRTPSVDGFIDGRNMARSSCERGLFPNFPSPLVGEGRGEGVLKSFTLRFIPSRQGGGNERTVSLGATEGSAAIPNMLDEWDFPPHLYPVRQAHDTALPPGERKIKVKGFHRRLLQSLCSFAMTGGASRKPRPVGGVRARDHVWFFPCREAPPCGRGASHCYTNT